MTNPIRMIFNHRLLALIGKEFTQIRRDSRLMVTMTIQPAVQLLLLGFALSAAVTNLKLGVVDDDQSIESASPTRNRVRSATPRAHAISVAAVAR